MMRELPGGPVLRLYTFTVQVSSLVITGQGTKIPHATQLGHTHTYKKIFPVPGKPFVHKYEQFDNYEFEGNYPHSLQVENGKKKKHCCCQSLSRVRLFVTPRTAAHQASLSFTISWRLCKLMSIESVMPSNHLILWRPLLPSILPSIRVFSNESALHIRWPK